MRTGKYGSWIVGSLALGVALVPLFVIAAASEAAPGAEHAFYVSPRGNDQAVGTDPSQPFATLQRAQRAVRQLREAGGNVPITVYLREGIFTLTEPLRFGPSDSGTASAPITYTAYPGEKPVLSGGRLIAGWKPFHDNIWMADVPEVKAGQWKFRQLFVNGEQRFRTQLPKKGFFRVKGFPDGGIEGGYHTPSQRFEFSPGDLDANWTNLQDVEVIVYHFWTDSHMPVRSIDTTSHIVTFANRTGKVFTDDFTSKGARYVVENVFEALQQPGEWYLNQRAGVLYYIPKPGEDLNQAEVVAPVLPAFIHVQGDTRNLKPVEYLTFRNLTFTYSRFELPPGNANDQQGSSSVPAAITLAGAQHCRFMGCTVRNLGTFAFELTSGCSENEFVGNEIAHIAAGGFRLNGGTERNHPLERTKNNIITDNHLHHYGEIYPSAVGILLMHTSGNLVAHNHIHHGWYTGISIGWVWGYARSISRDNRLEFNHIHDLGQGLLSDMGGIYTLGVSPGTVIRNNLIHDVDANQYGGWGIYNDEGSTHILVESNVVYNTKFAGYDIHYAKELTVRNNVFALGRKDQLSRTRVEPHKTVFFENNIVYWKEGQLFAGNWKDQPYVFYTNPMNKRTNTISSTFDLDWNVYFNPTKKLEDVRFDGQSFAEWQKRGKDLHSLYADPLFVDADHYDFRLKPESLALRLGFRPIDVSTVGPRNHPDSGQPPLVASATPTAVLVFSKTLGYRHANIPLGVAAIRQLGKEHGITVDTTEDSRVFTAENLARYQAVVFLSVTGDVLDEKQQTAFKDYVLNGGGFAAIHGALFGPLACEDAWAWYGELCCVAFKNHSAVVPARVDVEDPQHPSTQDLPEHWQRTDEWYNYSGTPRGRARVLATVDESTYTGGTVGADHPIAWCKRMGKGLMWYTAMGHTEESFREDLFLKHVLGGIQFVAGLKRGSCEPNSKLGDRR